MNLVESTILPDDVSGSLPGGEVMRIGLAIETEKPGGAETMLLHLAGELRGRNFEVVTLGPKPGSGWLTTRCAEMGIERDFVDGRGFLWLATVQQIAAWIRSKRISVLHSHEFGMAVCGALAARLTGCRHVITMHGGTYYAERVRRRVALRIAAGLSSHTVAVSESARKSMSELLGLPPERVEVVHNGVSVADGVPGRVRRELGLRPGESLVVAVGNLYPVKGHAVLLHAISRMPPMARQRTVVAIAGAGGEEPNLRRLATDLGIADAVRFLGFRTDVADLLCDADIFVMPSLSEGLPMAMIEAMLAGKAIVASDVGGIPELLPSADFGRLVPAGDAERLAHGLTELLLDPALRGSLGNAARARALARFTAAAMAEKYVSLYDRR